MEGDVNQLRKRELAVAAALIASVLVVTIGPWRLADHRSTSEESHLVFNYLIEQQLGGRWVSEFNAINSDWPPSRTRLAALLLEAHKEVARRQSDHVGMPPDGRSQ